MMEHAMIRSGHVDTFARDNLPPQAQWPEFSFTLPEQIEAGHVDFARQLAAKACSE